jgi:3-phosphoshikimate 1-carboxyvinyltransferase
MASSRMRVAPAARLRGELQLPGDKSISHRALMLALLATGESVVSGAGDGADVRSTAAIAGALGAVIERRPGRAGNVDYRVRSPGADGLRTPRASLDCGNSGTSLRLFAGLLAGRPLTATLDGDASLRGRPVARIIEPLRSMGATLHGDREDSRPPVIVTGRSPLRAIDWTTPVPSAQVKSAILLAGLSADGTTRVREAVATRDHTERMLRARGVTVRSLPGPAGGMTIEIEGGASVQAIDEQVPGDPSAATFWLVAAAIHPDAELQLLDVGVNPTRRAAIDLLRAMGASIEEIGPTDPDGVTMADGEPVASLRVRSSRLTSIEVAPSDSARAIDEIPALCLAASQARGRTVIRGAGELRNKESDRIAGTVEGLRALGVRIAATGDDLIIDGPNRLAGAAVDSRDDHRLAMTFAVAALAAEGATTVHGAPCVAISYPAFFDELERIRP